jgi:hypothetical protein
MSARAELRELIDEIFEEEALVLGGIVAVHDVDDDLVWRLVRNLDSIRGRALRRIAAQEPDPPDEPPRVRPDLRPHPAIEEFLLKIRRA